LNCDGDVAVTDSATAFIRSVKPDFLFIHLHDVDSVGHGVGHDTPEYYEAIERTDQHIGEILKAIRDAGMEKNTVVIFTADHGGIRKGHGSTSMNEMQIPWVIKGPGIKSNYEIQQSIMTFDTAATMAMFFGLKPPQVWIGRPVSECLADKK
jgi:arylsulfatase A-like enzyme